ncbi:hypothetical protein K493DRAFT_403826 [Basidiobolus meristosporus CBS 931.73]|uniref:Sodium channel modifier 1 n=1 Tax=Basidiobolus meristosporus CBS 931.73 TaxID=1314790 RepID=A0A1Y1Z9K4_9FUNG|nr:hypothetical protein K493DRAFT_403826 [Basidiobolus meristosporus CBS 931.73]|eukprot:ORY06941.1 hypothetical protein K493DRAFT_403826 [Basidiobolus meristosporus CBS 931.73]
MFKLTGERSRSENNRHTKRLTDELLAEKISPKEATLLANGKYKCLVCRWKPILDDIKQLSIHRKGRKHREEKETFSVKQLPIVKVQEETSSSTPLLSSTQEKMTKALLPGPRYNPLSTKKSERVDNRSIFQPQFTRQQPKPKAKPIVATTYSSQDYVFPWMVQGPKITKGKQSVIVGDDQTPVSPEEVHRIALEKYHLQLAQAGWKRDENGEFVKDESVEFDSDEELPLPPPPPPGLPSQKE